MHAAGWNVLDVIIIGIGYISVAGHANVTALRALRALRPLRTIRRIKEMRVSGTRANLGRNCFSNREGPAWYPT